MTIQKLVKKAIPSGGTSETDPPVTIPNTEVKRFSTDDTAVATPWENRPLPGGYMGDVFPLTQYLEPVLPLNSTG